MLTRLYDKSVIIVAVTDNMQCESLIGCSSAWGGYLLRFVTRNFLAKISQRVGRAQLRAYC